MLAQHLPVLPNLKRAGGTLNSLTRSPLDSTTRTAAPRAKQTGPEEHSKTTMTENQPTFMFSIVDHRLHVPASGVARHSSGFVRCELPSSESACAVVGLPRDGASRLINAVQPPTSRFPFHRQDIFHGTFSSVFCTRAGLGAVHVNHILPEISCRFHRETTPCEQEDWTQASPPAWIS